MTIQTFNEALVVRVADATAVNTSTAETVIVPDYPFVAGYFYQGRTIRISAWGVLSSLTATTPNITLRFRMGTGTLSATFVVASGALAFTSTAITNGSWRLEGQLTCRNTGTAGTGMFMGQVFLPNLTAATTVGGEGYNNTMPVTGSAVGTIDTTVQNLMSLSAQWSASSASNSITVQQYILEAIT